MGREERGKTAGNGCALTKEIALNLLTIDGSAAIWLIHLTAAKAYRHGHPRAAQILIEIADVAEQEWLRNPRETSQFSNGSLGNRGARPVTHKNAGVQFIGDDGVRLRP